jgi:hypothetical protein
MSPVPIEKVKIRHNHANFIFYKTKLDIINSLTQKNIKIIVKIDEKLAKEYIVYSVPRYSKRSTQLTYIASNRS